MLSELSTSAEQRAQRAEKLPAFDGLNLLGLKRDIQSILGLIGRDGIFDEYTAHDISHIDAMLLSLDWLIPQTTQNIMSPADWLMLVLSIYFHDMGMLVTKEEFANRDESDYPEFCENFLFSEDVGMDYESKIQTLSEDERERFLYQEFVRHTHAVRIREWIHGRAPKKLGHTHQAMKEVSEILKTLDTQFRRDLGLVCESHHLDDLHDFEKYKVSIPYGNSDEETVNLQYISVLLRTVDLLHITRDRTPSLSFRLINPNDPISQVEWVKQMAVRRVRSKIASNKEGIPDESISRDTIEVHAYFEKPDGFFGLTSYLEYARRQLSKSFDWIQQAQKTTEANKFLFPWRYIDDTSVETSGFLKDSFKFTFDQKKLLELLIGHTLYNETSVVLRELVQNSLDAIRLRLHIESAGNDTVVPGQVDIHWDSKQKILSISDNGTGMTQETIQRHFLTVGSSKYQDSSFQKEFPNFHSISHFGIGVLSTFMVADNVEIITSHIEEKFSRMLELRSVHGRYLIQLLRKDDERLPENLRQHGTRVRLFVRKSADIGNILETAQRWIVLPQCSVNVRIDDKEPVSIGYTSPEEALRSAVAKNTNLVLDEEFIKSGSSSKDLRSRVKVREVHTPVGTVAFLLKWHDYFNEWSFLTASELYREKSGYDSNEFGSSVAIIDGDVVSYGHGDKTPKSSLTGICVEGIRVDFNPPGFKDANGIAALVNTTGMDAPKTNVARSNLEQTTEEYDHMLRLIYDAYCNHVKDELDELQKRRGFSLTWAVQEARWLISPLSKAEPISRKALLQTIYEVPLLLVEENQTRKAISIKKLIDVESFWTIDAKFFSSAELLIREVSSSASLAGIISTLGVENFDLPNSLVVCDTAINTSPYSEALSGKEVSCIRMDRQHRRLDLKWSKKQSKPMWLRFPELEYRDGLSHREIEKRIRIQNLSRPIYSFSSYDNIAETRKIHICSDGVEVVGHEGETAVIHQKYIFILPNSELWSYLNNLHKLVVETGEEFLHYASMINTMIGERLSDRSIDMDKMDAVFEGYNSEYGQEVPKLLSKSTLTTLLSRDGLFKTFDISRWSRSESIY